MSITSLPVTLTPPFTSEREAVADAIYRAVLALDTDDTTLFKSSVTDDTVCDLNGTVMNGIDAIIAHPVWKLDTTHHISNLRINITDGASKAQVTCSGLAQHYRAGEGMKPGAAPLLAGSLYWIELVKDAGDGLWKFKHWKIKTTWGHGEWGVFGS